MAKLLKEVNELLLHRPWGSLVAGNAILPSISEPHRYIVSACRDPCRLYDFKDQFLVLGVHGTTLASSQSSAASSSGAGARHDAVRSLFGRGSCMLDIPVLLMLIKLRCCSAWSAMRDWARRTRLIRLSLLPHIDQIH